MLHWPEQKKAPAMVFWCRQKNLDIFFFCYRKKKKVFPMTHFILPNLKFFIRSSSDFNWAVLTFQNPMAASPKNYLSNHLHLYFYNRISLIPVLLWIQAPLSPLLPRRLWLQILLSSMCPQLSFPQVKPKKIHFPGVSKPIETCPFALEWSSQPFQRQHKVSLASTLASCLTLPTS